MTSGEARNVGKADAEQLTDELVKEVYAWFGVAVFRAQMFEFQLASLLWLVAKWKKRDLTPQEWDELDGELSKQTLGTLLRDLNKHFCRGKVEFRNREGRTVQEMDLNECFASALKTRNKLAHHFARINAKRMLTAPGCRELVGELASMADVLGKADCTAEAMWNAVREQLGIPQELAESYARAALEKARGVDVVND